MTCKELRKNSLKYQKHTQYSPMIEKDQIMITLHLHPLLSNRNRDITGMDRLAINGIIQNLVQLLIILAILIKVKVNRNGSKTGSISLNSKVNFNKILMFRYLKYSKTTTISNRSPISTLSSAHLLSKWLNKFLRMFSPRTQIYSSQFKDTASPTTIYN